MANLLTGKPRLNREVNRRLILERIRRNGQTSRAELAKLTAIRPPTVSAIIRELIEEGLVIETGQGEPSGGRAPRIVTLRRSQPQAMGFEVNDTEILAGLCDLGGRLCFEARAPFGPATPEATVTRLAEIGGQLLRDAEIQWSDLQGVGVALPGHLRSPEGIVRWSQPFGWHDVPLRVLCERQWGVQTDVVNDSVAGGMAAHFLGAGQTVRNLVHLYLRFLDSSRGVVGIGTGIILNGESFHGEFGAAGEITTPVAHPLTDARDARGGRFSSLDAFLAAFRANEPSAVAAIDRVAQDLSALVLHAVNLLEPGMVIIGSDVEALREAMAERFTRILDEHRLSYEAGVTRILASTLGEFGVVRGAVVPTLQRVFRMPQWS